MEFSAVNTIWVLVGAALVFFMQAGFAMVETGFTRAKNAGNIIMKNLMDFCIGTPVFWLVGFGLMFGAGNGFIGKIGGIATEAHYGSGMLPDGVPFWAFLIFQTVFCATSATIVSGAMAERTKFLSYCVYSLMISLVVYPVSGHWIWGGGFISQMGFHDFAGSCAVHMVGGVAAFIGAVILGPRIGKYSKSGKSKAIPGHNLTVGALGVFILWFCWFGFNGASTVSMEGDAIVSAGKIILSKVDTTSKERIVETIQQMNDALALFHGKPLLQERLKIKKWDEMTQEDYQELLNSQYTNDYIEKLWFNQNDAFQSLYYMNNRFNQDEFIQKINHIFKDQDCGHVMRVKGFYQKEKHWYEINMTQENTSIQEINQGQDVIIVIGEELNKNKIDQYFK